MKNNANKTLSYESTLFKLERHLWIHTIPLTLNDV